MRARVVAIALGPQLVALVTGPANSPTNRSGYSCCSYGRSIWVLAVMLHVRRGSGEVGAMHPDMLLKLLESIMGALTKAVEPVVV